MSPDWTEPHAVAASANWDVGHGDSTDGSAAWLVDLRRALGDAGVSSGRETTMEQPVQQEDDDDQEDGLLTTVLFVALGLCILMALAVLRG